ncbi:MAG: PA2169 family four-helix-bundle protein [Chloroflexaceae bacterium]|nr:PA2169 family four-helix-bundle protein [Chloroflexaceae bacterium]
MDQKKLVDTLNDVIETLQDGVDGYRRAAEDAKSPELKTLFRAFADQRAGFKNEVQSVVARFGATPETSGSMAAKVHRGWLDLKKTFAERNDEAILEECANGDEVALHTYDSALDNTDLPADVRTLLQAQRVAVQEAHDRVEALEARMD